MKRPFFLFLALSLGVALSGCANTLNGARQDAATDVEKARQAAQQADQAAKAAARKAKQAVEAVPQNAEANTIVRPAVKLAIIRDLVLAQPINLINVNAGPRKIVLTGHVADASMKQRATEDAQVALKKHPGYILTNNLVVSGGSAE